MQVRKELHTRWSPTKESIVSIDTTDSPDDEHEVAQNMYRIEINI
jgi:hypothetical protein